VVELDRLRSRGIESPASEGASSLAPSGPCTNCGSGPVIEYCAACGQRHVTPQHFTARSFFHELLGEFVSLDGRFWLTLWTLVRHPGKLAREYFDGRGARYMRPLNLFLLLNLVFFVIQPHTGLLQWHLRSYLRNIPDAPRLVEQKRLARAEAAEADRRKRGATAAGPKVESMEIFEANFEATLQNLKKSMLLLAIPIFAVVLAALYGTKHRIAEHLIFSTHFYAYSIFSLTVVVPLLFSVVMGTMRLVHAPRSAIAVIGSEPALTVSLLGLFGAYLYVGVRRMYGDGRLPAVLRAAALSAAYQVMVGFFAVSAFRVTLWAM
jgi:hypothetical protein